MTRCEGEPSTTDRLLEAITQNERGSYAEWGAAIHVVKAVVLYHLRILERDGRIRRTPGTARSVEVVREVAATGDINIAIRVLTAYAAGELPPSELRTALETAIEEAYNGGIEIDINLDAPPVRRGRTA